MRQIGQMLAIVAAIAFLSSDGVGQVTFSSDSWPFSASAAKPVPISAKNVSSSINASLLVLEMDWSKSPTAKEIEVELQAAFKDLKLDAKQRQHLLVFGPQILFDRDKALYYTHEHLNALIPWLEHHTLIKGRIDGTHAMVRDVSKRSEEELLGKARTSSVRPMMGEKLSPEPCIVIRDEHLLPFPKQSPDLGPFFNFSESKFWLIMWTQVDGQVNVISRLMYSSEQREWGEPSIDKAENIKACIDSRLVLFPGHAAIISAGHCTEAPGPFGEDHLALSPWLTSLEMESVLPILVISTEQIHAAPKAFLLPDKVKLQPAIARSPANERLEIVAIGPGDTSGNATPPANNPSLSTDLAVSPAETSTSPNIDPVVVKPQGGLERRSLEPNTVPSAVTSSIADLKRNYDAREHRIMEMARELQQNPAKAKELDEKLRTAVAEAFTLRQQLHQAELNEFQQRMQKSQELIQTRDKMKDQIIERRVQELRHPDLKWDASKRENSKIPTTKGQIELSHVSEQAEAQQLQLLQRFLLDKWSNEGSTANSSRDGNVPHVGLYWSLIDPAFNVPPVFNLEAEVRK